jgi:hypothetical protein
MADKISQADLDRIFAGMSPSMGPQTSSSGEKGSITPRLRASDDSYSTSSGAGVNWTTKKGVSIDFDVDKTDYKDSDYKEPEGYRGSISKRGDKLSYGVSGSKKGERKDVEASFTWKYKHGGSVMARGCKMGRNKKTKIY